MDPAETTDKSTLKTPEKDIYTWIAPARPFKRADREFYITIISMAVLVGIILFLVEGFMPVILLVSLVFLYYVMSTVPPENAEYKITSKGIKFSDKLTPWEVLNRYWFSKRFDHNLLVFETTKMPGRIEFVVLPEHIEEIRGALKEYLNEEKASPSQLDKAASWLSDKLQGKNKVQ
jgi:hypothetical protein